jgi:hypothetical protein
MVKQWRLAMPGLLGLMVLIVFGTGSPWTGLTLAWAAFLVISTIAPSVLAARERGQDESRNLSRQWRFAQSVVSCRQEKRGDPLKQGQVSAAPGDDNPKTGSGGTATSSRASMPGFSPVKDEKTPQAP